jgi:hypothetical protein
MVRVESLVTKFPPFCYHGLRRHRSLNVRCGQYLSTYAGLLLSRSRLRMYVSVVLGSACPA